MSEWCQNKRCAEKKNQNQMRGSKGSRYYQSNKAQQRPKNSRVSIAYYYFNRFCSQGCFHSYLIANETAVFNLVPEIDRKITGVDDAWECEHERNYNNGNGREDIYFLVNRLQSVHHAITREQAQSPEDIQAGHSWNTIDDTQAKELAVTLGLAS